MSCTHADEHFAPLRDDEVEFIEYAAVVTEKCRHAEILGRAHDAGRDEVHEVAGRSCGSTRTIRLHPTRVVTPDGEEIDVDADELEFDGEGPVYDALRAVERVAAEKGAGVIVNGGERSRTAEADGYRVVYADD